MWRRKDHRLKRIDGIFTLDRVEGLTWVNRSFGFNEEVCSNEWLFLGRKSVYENDHDKSERRKGLGPGGGLRNPRSRLGRVGSMKLSDNLGGMT